MVEGDSGILAVHPNGFRPRYEPSKRRLTWPNGAVATLFNAVEPDQLRGPQHDAAWSDELAKWRYARDTWDMLQFGLRLGERPLQIITTTPRPIPVLKEIMAQPGTVVTRGSSLENKSNLAPSFIRQMVDRYAGTRLGRQEINAEILDDVIGALWNREVLDKHRRSRDDIPDLVRVVVAIDPAITSSKDPNEAEQGAETGIVVAGLGVDGRGYVLGDYSCRMGPNGWANRALNAFDDHEGDVIVGEVNQGGEMVENTVRSARPSVPFIPLRASRGKTTRAEPVAALYEQGKISHVGSHAALEDQMMLFTQFGIEGDTTADRVDALVWALTELFHLIIVHKDAKDERKKRDVWDAAFGELEDEESNVSWKAA